MLSTTYDLHWSIRPAARLAVLAALTAACGGSGGNGGPAPPTGPGGSTTIITITSAGTNPRNVTVDLGTRIRWVNSDNRVHEPSSDPHPEHDICPALNVGTLGPGQSRDSQNLVTARACGYHDHLLPEQPNLTGTITIR